MRRKATKVRSRLASAAVRCQPDSRLVGLVRDGHEAAFEEIVRRYRPALVSFAGAIVPADHAEDVVQEALAKAHRALGRGDAEINLRPWLYIIVRNRALNALRDEPAHDHLDENFDGVPQPPEVAARREELAALIASVQRLPAQQRAALIGRELEGRSHEEIAASLGTTPGSVRGLIFRARTALRDGMGLLIPMPVLRAALGSDSAASEAAGAGGAAAAGLAAGGGGIAAKAGATLGVAVIAIGSGLAIQHRDSRSDGAQAAGGHPRSGAVASASDARSSRDGASSELETRSGRGGPGSGSDDSGSGENSGPSSSSGPGPGSRSDESSGSGESGHGGSSGSDDSGGGGSSGSGDDGGSSGTSDGGGSSGTSDGGGDDGGGGIAVASDDGGGDGSSDSSDGGDGETTTTTTTTTTSDGEGPG